MARKPSEIEIYLQTLPADRAEAMGVLRKLFLKHLPAGYEERLESGMLQYVVPHRLYPQGYHCNPSQPLFFASMASKKGHMAVYLMSLYLSEGESEWLQKAFKAAGKKLQGGKSCIRFKKLEDLPLEVIAEALSRMPVEKYVACYERALKRRH